MVTKNTAIVSRSRSQGSVIEKGSNKKHLHESQENQEQAGKEGGFVRRHLHAQMEDTGREAQGGIGKHSRDRGPGICCRGGDAVSSTLALRVVADRWRGGGARTPKYVRMLVRMYVCACVRIGIT